MCTVYTYKCMVLANPTSELCGRVVYCVASTLLPGALRYDAPKLMQHYLA